jgi:hypothetical protein
MELQIENKPKRSIQYYAERKARDLITEFEYNLDIFISNKRAKFSPIDLIKERKASAFSVQKVHAFYSRIKDSTDAREQLFLELVIDDCERYLNTKQKAKQKKTRLPKEKPVEKIVSKLNYMKEFQELELVSIDPALIPKSQMLCTYNTKTRKFTIFQAIDAVPFTLNVSRSSITQFIEQKSVQKTLRDPKKQLEKLLQASTTTLWAEFNKIKAKTSVPSGRINADTILVKTFQV